jgi:phosphoribosylamine--glycine ligase
MRVLVIGSGAREHALCWALRRSATVDFLACLPGNGGTAAIATNVSLDPMDFAACVAWAVAERIDLTVVGPDDPLGAGIVDAFQAEGLRCLGPTQAAARIESSKVWSKAFMQRHAIPTAPARIVTAATLDDALRALHTPATTFPLAVKADGLAAGKGVIIAHTADEAEAALRAMISDHRFGAAGASVLLESFLYGREVSVFALCDGAHYRLFGTACDHKRALDGDQGDNTGGMGAYAPADWLPATTLAEIERTVIAPTIAGLAAEGYPFQGFLFAGLMITAAGPSVIEFNARFGDPEAQAIVPLLQTPLLDLCVAAADGTLATQPALRWRPDAACGVVLATHDYPAPGAKDLPITGLDRVDPDTLIFQAGTKLNADGTLVTNGGRILTVVGFGPDRATARAHAYANVDRIHFAGARYRTDIGAR